MSETRYTLTIVIETDADPSQLLDEAHELGELLTDTLHSMGNTVTIDEQDTCVSEVSKASCPFDCTLCNDQG